MPIEFDSDPQDDAREGGSEGDELDELPSRRRAWTSLGGWTIVLAVLLGMRSVFAAHSATGTGGAAPHGIPVVIAGLFTLLALGAAGLGARAALRSGARRGRVFLFAGVFGGLVLIGFLSLLAAR